MFVILSGTVHATACSTEHPRRVGLRADRGVILHGLAHQHPLVVGSPVMKKQNRKIRRAWSPAARRAEE